MFEDSFSVCAPVCVPDSVVIDVEVVAVSDSEVEDVENRRENREGREKFMEGVKIDMEIVEKCLKRKKGNRWGQETRTASHRPESANFW